MHASKLDRGSASPFRNNPKSEMQKRPRGPKWSWLSVIALALVLVAGVAQAQTKIFKIGWLSAVAGANPGQQKIVRMLRELGYVEVKNIVYEYRYADSKLERLPALADELVRLKVDLLLTPGTPGALALQKATRTIPIVFADVTDPVAAGLVDSLARPGRNLTRFTNVQVLLAGQQLGLIKGNRGNRSYVPALRDPPK